MIVRDGADGLEVLLLRRSPEASFMPGSWVFPGGVLEPGDVQLALDTGVGAAVAADWAARFGDDDPGLAPAFGVAAVRECLEECGLWLGVEEVPASEAVRQVRAGLTTRSSEGRLTLAETIERLGLSVRLDILRPWARWVTPIDLPRRFDTRFFIAVAPPGQGPTVDGSEIVDASWVTPAAALASHARTGLGLAMATLTLLGELARHADVASLLAGAGSASPIEAVHPRRALGPGGSLRHLRRGDAAYAQVQLLDPWGRGDAQAWIEPGTVVRLAPGLRRLTAPNPGLMSGPGTNSYLLGGGADGDGRVAVLDPGPDLPAHVEALLAAIGDDRLDAVLVTHTHLDHSPAARRLAERTGARVIGRPAPAGLRQDGGFAPDQLPEDGEWFDLAGLRLQALHTPGHASNHVCWWLPEERLLFTGDHLMQGSTVVIDPPDGDMSAYLASLRGLPARLPTLEWLAPGHGFLIDRPVAAIERVIGHRLAREAKVLAALPARPDGAVTLAGLLPRAYDDVAPTLHAPATRSLLAHLLKLRAEGVAVCTPVGGDGGDPGAGDERWHRAPD